MSGLREELLRIARLLTADQGELSENEYDLLVEKWASLCPHPGETDIIFWPNELGLCGSDELNSFRMSPEEMVDYALSWKPRVVAMRVIERRGGPAAKYYLYRLEAPDTLRTQVATGLNTVHEPGEVLAVALKGIVLQDGTHVATTYKYGVASSGRIISRTDCPVGTQLVHGA